jgi:phenylpyruvate tautomerase PptA (4-oxalocrotonate tautomerase family)
LHDVQVAVGCSDGAWSALLSFPGGGTPERRRTAGQVQAMPLVRIETRRWLTREAKRALFDAVHGALVSAFKVPDHDRNQRIIEYAPEDFEASAGKGERFTIVTIDAFAGRSLEAKRQLYQELVKRTAEVGIPAADLVVVVHDVPLESWGTRGGRAACDIDLGFEIRV